MADKLHELSVLTFKTQPGQDLLDELRKTYVERNNYVQGDTHETAYRLGEANIVSLLIQLATHEVKNV
jgi:hypothetical protein